MTNVIKEGAAIASTTTWVTVGKQIKRKHDKTFAKSKSSDDEEPMEFASEELPETKKWYQDLDVDDTSFSAENEVKYEELEKLRKEAKSVMEGAVAVNSNKPPKSISESDFAWMKTVMAKGTKGDKIAAYVVLIQDSPLYTLNLLNNIIGMVKVGKKEWTSAAESLMELFLNDLLPPDKKLVLFSNQPLKLLKNMPAGSESKRKNLLLLWYFENQLKLAYRDFIAALNQIAHDSVDANKEKAIGIMAKLLENNPEQESALLSNIVNKLGDPSHKVGSKVIYTLTKLLQVHPNMREVVMNEVEKLLFRSNISKRAQYYGVCFLAQFCLSNNDAKIAKKLISIYLSIFKACVKTGEIDSRMMGALLTGVNRAYPFAKDDMAMLQEHVNTIYKVVHFGKPSVSIQALSLLYLISDQNGSLTDRFFMVLYKKILELKLYNSTHHAMFLNLIFKSLRKDNSPERITAFLKRLLQVSSYLSASLVCGILFLISEVLVKKKLNLLLEHKVTDSARNKFDYSSDDDDDSDGNKYGYEKYEDVPLESDDEGAELAKDSAADKTPPNGPPVKDGSEIIQKQLKVWRNPNILPVDRKKELTEYDPYHRNPLFSGGNKTPAVELYKLISHYHPSVSHFASTILKGERIKYSGDPLQDFALIRFLDKFSFKNPKSLKSEEQEEKETFARFGKRKIYNQIITRRFTLSKENFLTRNEENIPVDEKFIFSYLKDRHSKISSEKEKEDDEDSDIDSVGSEEFEEMIHKMVGTKDVEDIDFLNEAGQLPKKEKEKHSGKEVEEGVEDDEMSGDEMSDGGSFAESFDGDEVEDMSDDLLEGSELDESEIPPSLMHLKDVKKGGKKHDSKRTDRFSKSNLFASAEEFSELLEQSDYLAGGSQAVSNRDNAGAKQLKWETERNQGFRRGNKRKNFNSRKTFGKSKGRESKKRRKM